MNGGFRGRGRGGFQSGGGMGRGGGGMGRGGGGPPRKPRVEDKDQFKKLFIGGLNRETTSDSLKAYFEQWGEITDCVVMKDANTGKAKGFGFITYANEASVDDVQDKRPHTVDGREVDTKRAMPKEDAGKPECKETTKKVFLGGLKEDTADDHVRCICEEFGAIEKVDIIRDKESGKCRGFGFVTFTDTDKVDKIYLKGSVEINGRNVEVKKAVEKGKLNPAGGDAGGAGYGRGGGTMAGGGGGGMYAQQQQAPAYGGGGGGYASAGYPPAAYGAQGAYGQPPAYAAGGYGAPAMGTGYEGGYSAGPVRGGYAQQRPSPYGAPGAGYGAAAGGYGAAAGGYGAGAGAYGQRRY